MCYYPYGENRAGVGQAGLSCMCIQESFLPLFYSHLIYRRCFFGDSAQSCFIYAMNFCIDNTDFNPEQIGRIGLDAERVRPPCR